MYFTYLYNKTASIRIGSEDNVNSEDAESYAHVLIGSDEEKAMMNAIERAFGPNLTQVLCVNHLKENGGRFILGKARKIFNDQIYKTQGNRS